MTLSPRTIARSIFRWDWLSCISSALRRTRFMCGSNPSRIPRYPRPPFSSTITFELIRWLRRESGLIIGPRRSHGGGVLKGLREGLNAPLRFDERATPLPLQGLESAHEVHHSDPARLPLNDRRELGLMLRCHADRDWSEDAKS